MGLLADLAWEASQLNKRERPQESGQGTGPGPVPWPLS